MGKINILAVLCLLPMLITAFPDGVTRIPLSHHHHPLRKGEGREVINSGSRGTICVGTPCQNFTVVMDSGSSEFWIAADTCKSGCETKTKFHASESSTFVQGNDPFSLVYGSAEVVGTFSYDSVTVGGLTATHQKVGQASIATAFDNVDGILGLGLKDADKEENTLFFSSLVKQNAVREPVFTFCFSPAHSEEQNNEIIFGGSNQERHKGKNFAFAEGLGTTKWDFSMDGIEINGKIFYKGYRTIADTGNTHLSGPVDVIHTINTALGAERVHTHKGKIVYQIKDCVLRELPTISIKINGKDFRLRPREYMRKERGGICTSEFQISGFKHSPIINLGRSFLQGKCSQFDFKNKKVGFVEIDY